ncbi:MAG: AI-2E family transporter [Oscillospiraceae bacterium]|nr:AI-2E family transporter [Oscillospiraceae bacterium]
MEQPDKTPLYRERLLHIIIVGGGVLLLLAFVILRYEGFFAMLRYLLKTVRPLLLGVLFASVLNRPFRRIETDLLRLRKHRHCPLSPRQCHVLALLITVLLTLLILAGIVCVILPQLTQSVSLLTEHSAFYGENLRQWLAANSPPFLLEWLSGEQAGKLMEMAKEYLPTVLAKTYDYTADFLGCVADVGIGAVFSVYLLADGQRLKSQAADIVRRVVGKERQQWLASSTRMICMTFARFFSSQLTEAVILGSLCYVGMLLFAFPYPVLISVIIGLTNIVPYVGPVVGTIPCVAILLMVKPDTALWFLLFVIVLQQLESNLIYPRIVGHSVGLPPAWVLSAIVIGGGLWGIAGLLFGVPLTAVIFTVLFGKQDGEPSQQCKQER